MSAATVTNPISKQGLDEALTDPANDLLDVDKHARALAHYIREQENQLPFTVGILGEWGEGKTTMVGFLQHHLGELRKKDSNEPIKFVNFSSWPFTTSERLWRALILEIAKVLFKYDRKAAEEKEKRQKLAKQQKTDSSGWMNRLSFFLTSDFFPKKHPPEPLSAYEQFVNDLEETDFGRISRRTPTPQVDQQTMMTAVVHGALTILGTMSPLISGLRGLVGQKIDVEQLPKAQTNESSPDVVEALQRFRRIFGEMLSETTKDGEVIYVFIDDLDRARPDVALDIVESIRIALTDVKCVFIIAFDDTLISRALFVRYKDVLDTSRLDEGLANKGWEYLEKIIQFKTRVPPRTNEQTKRLIAAEFPEWTPAGDIIQTIATNNPRRIKQYCQRLRFQKAVGSTLTLGSAGNEAETPEIFETPGLDESSNFRREFIPPSGPNDVVMLSRVILELSQDQIRELFLLLERPYAEVPGNTTAEKVESFVMRLHLEGKGPMLRDAIRSVNAGIRFPDE
jgi:KAP-like P-loop domain-containing protein